MIEELADIVGKENFSDKDIELLSYSSDASRVRGGAVGIVWPVTTEQVQGIVRHAREHNLNLVPRGGGTSLVGGAVPQDSLVVDMCRMNRVLELKPDGRHAVVEPGVIAERLNRRLAEHGLFFPVVPSSHRVCTIGGMIAANAGGNRTIRYGKTNEWVAEIEAVDGSSKVRHLTEREEIDAFCGSEGILGIVTRAKLVLTELIEDTSLDLHRFENAKDVIDVVERFREDEEVIAIEYFDSQCAGLLGLEARHHVIIEFKGGRGKIRSREEIDKIWRMREGLGSILGSRGHTIIEDPKVPLERMGEFLRWFEKNGIPAFGHIGVGILHPRFKISDREKIAEMYARVRELGGSVSGEHGIGVTKKEFADKRYIENLKKLKEDYDPENLFNRGKVF